MRKRLVQLLLSLVLLSSVFLVVPQSVYAANSATMLLSTVPAYPFTITNAEGQYATFNFANGPVVTGTMPIVSQQLKGIPTPRLMIEVPESSSYTYEFQGDLTGLTQSFTVSGPSYTVIVNAENTKSMTVGLTDGEASVSLSGTDMSYAVDMKAPNSQAGYITLTGKGSGTVTMKDTAQGVEIGGTSGLCTFTSNDYEGTKTSVKTVDFIRTADTVVVSNFSGTVLKVTGADIIPKPKPVTVTFNSKGGTPVVKQELSITFDKDSTATYPQATKPADPTKKGYTFKGWFTKEGKQWDFASEVKENLTLYAHWTVDSKKVDQPDGGGLPPSGDAGASYILPALLLTSGIGALGILVLKRKKG